MGCMLGCNKHYDDDGIDNHRRHNHHHYQRSHRRIVPQYGYCLDCHCQQYVQHHRDSHRCFCGHTLREHQRI